MVKLNVILLLSFCFLGIDFNVVILQNTKVSLNDCAKSVADIDTRIEELQRKIEIERLQKEKIVHDIRALVKPSATANSYALASRKHSVSQIICNYLSSLHDILFVIHQADFLSWIKRRGNRNA